ncbi:hypothetical protein [Rhodococcus sp. IEGM 1302]|uniref:GTP pyrophosphokinase n=1 Tax=Rhodococcus sp. IEGM 1302 TaxID=3047093 RepID=UPI0024B77F2D|nr:hypothetical protein [Rhodococcus sp. IEGM 1302]MDI9947417.1 hypothetical protein [Rhodococcus sp. IEGM 1302]
MIGNEPAADKHPQSSSTPTQTVPQHVWEFAQEQDVLKRTADQMRDYLYELSTEATIPVHTIETRAKKLASYMDKCSRKNEHGEFKYQNPRAEIDDCVAARVIVYTTRARQDFVDLLLTRCVTRDHENPGHKKRNGYDSDHLVVTSIGAQHLSARYPDLATHFRLRPGIEVQIRTVAGHAWAEYEHDVRYKSPAYKDLGEGARKQIDQRFIEAGGLRRYLDTVFNEIDELLLPTDTAAAAAAAAAGDDDTDTLVLTERDDRALDPATLTEFMKVRYPNSEPGSHEVMRELLDQLGRLDVNTLAGLEKALARTDGQDVAALMDYPAAVSAARQLDDELLAAFSRSYVEAAAPDEVRQQLLRLRLRRVDGKFAIYVLDVEGRNATRPITAARAVRDLTRIAAEKLGPDAVQIEGAIALNRSDLPDHTNPRVVQSGNIPIYVATNLGRSYSEWLMAELVRRMPEGHVRVFRAGDQVFPVID